MNSWSIQKYGSISSLALCKKPIPVVNCPNQILVKVSASSINPIDIAMLGGYGSRVLNAIRLFCGSSSGCGSMFSSSIRQQLEFPLTVGRDFSGYIVAKGMNVSDQKHPIGQAVFGFVPVHKQGSHADYVLVDSCNVHAAPESHNLNELAALPYAGMTAWSALWLTAGLALTTITNTKTPKRVLVLGASGGVGSLAVQMLQAHGHTVDAVCSTASIPFVQSLGVHTVLDYTKFDTEPCQEQQFRYDIVLDCSPPSNIDHSAKWNCNTFVTLTSPLLRNTDSNGLVAGTVQSLIDLFGANVKGFIDKRQSIRWAYFVPLPNGLSFLYDLLVAEKVKPKVAKTFEFNDMPSALEYVTSGETINGKILITNG